MGSLLTNWAYGIYAIEGVLVMFCVFSVLFVVALVGLIYAGYSLTIKNIGVKAGLDGTWRAWIPVAQDVYMLKAARMKLWCLPFFGFTGLLSFATIFFCAWGIPYRVVAWGQPRIYAALREAQAAYAGSHGGGAA